MCRCGAAYACVLSPTLFLVFINDLLDDLKYGVRVPGCGEMRVPGLLWADDGVVLAAHPLRLRQALNRISGWAVTNEAEFGIDDGGSKCAIMAVGVGEDVLQRQQQEHQWALRGKQVPLTDEYKYLGTVINKDLDLKRTVSHRVRRAERAYRALVPALSNKFIPPHVKVTIARHLLWPTCTWGAQLFGLSAALLRPLQRVFTRALRLCFAAPHSTSEAVLLREADMPPLVAYAAGARATALVKWQHAPTVVADVLRSPYRGRKRTWASGTTTFLRRNGHGCCVTGDYELAGRVSWHVRQHVSQQWFRRKSAKSQAAQRYEEHSLFRTRPDAALAAWQHLPRVGARALQQGRLGAFFGATRLSAMGKIAPEWRARCPFCLEHKKEKLPHLLAECAAWAEERAQLLTPVLALKDPRNRWGMRPPTSAAKVRDLAYLYLGGEVRGQGGLPTLRTLLKKPLVPPRQRQWLYATAACLAAVWPWRMQRLSALATAHSEARLPLPDATDSDGTEVDEPEPLPVGSQEARAFLHSVLRDALPGSSLASLPPPSQSSAASSQRPRAVSSLALLPPPRRLDQCESSSRSSAAPSGHGVSLPPRPAQ